MKLEHPCFVCGDQHAPWGHGPAYGVQQMPDADWLRHTRWYCTPHRPPPEVPNPVPRGDWPMPLPKPGPRPPAQLTLF